MPENTHWENLKKGDKTALDALFKLYYHPLYVYLLQHTKNRFETEDILQGVFMYLWEKREHIEIRQSMKPYLYKAAYNAFIDQTRQEKRKDMLLESLKHETLIEEIEEDDAEVQKKIQRVKQQIELLPKRCREIFLLSKYEGYYYDEIAEILGISVKTVESQMRLAFKKIREGFENDNMFLFLLSHALIG